MKFIRSKPTVGLQSCKAPVTDDVNNDDNLDIGHGVLLGLLLGKTGKLCVDEVLRKKKHF